MAIAAGEADSTEPNPPKATAMAIIASLTFNVVIGSIFGSPGVLLKPMRDHLGVSTEAISLASLLVIVFSAITAPQIGALAAKRSLRGLLAGTAIAMAVGWTLLAFTQSYLVYLAVYALLLGPSMAVGASILPPTLVTRWFNRNRGLALGIVHLPYMVAAMPLLAEWTISSYGLRTTFLMLAALPIIVLLPASLLLIDHPPGEPVTVTRADPVAERPAHAMMSLTVPQLLKLPSFWGICLVAGVANASSTMLGVHLVSMAESWGIERTAAAGLASIMSAVGAVGSITLGLLTDRIGGVRTMLVIALADAVLWALFLLGLPYAGLAGVIGMIGLFGAGMVPAMAKALADTFGRASFSRAIGLMIPVTLPILFAALIGPGTVVRLTGSYTIVIVAMSTTFAVAALLAAGVSRGSRAAEPLPTPA